MFKTMAVVFLSALCFSSSAFSYFTIPIYIPQGAGKVEAEAYARAALNVDRANCMLALVDQKIDGDIQLGYIREFSLITKAHVCGLGE